MVAEKAAQNHHGKREPLKLVIADDHLFMRDLMARMLARQRRSYSVVASVGTAGEAIAACARFTPDLLVLDIRLPDKRGIDIVPEVKQVAPPTRVLLCTAFPVEETVACLARSGADGFVEKTNTWDEFLVAIDRVSRGERYFFSRSLAFSRPAPSTTTNGGAAERLTPRQKEIVTLIARGLTSKDIAAKLHISVATVETHRNNLMAKLGVRNVAELVSRAFHSGWVAK